LGIAAEIVSAEDPTMRKAGFLATFILVTGLAFAPAHAGSPDADEPRLSEELDQIFRNLIEQMKPALDELLETLEMLENIDSIEHYERPEIQPNGDIIIRRREDAPPLPNTDTDEPETGPSVRT
jgi:hypothetical protein